MCHEGKRGLGLGILKRNVQVFGRNARHSWPGSWQQQTCLFENEDWWNEGGKNDTLGNNYRVRSVFGVFDTIVHLPDFSPPAIMTRGGLRRPGEGGTAADGGGGPDMEGLSDENEGTGGTVDAAASKAALADSRAL